MINKVIIVPDVHGRTFWRLAKEKVDEVDKIVFLGDYLDPYPAEGITTEDAIKEFEEIIEFKKIIMIKLFFSTGIMIVTTQIYQYI